MRRVFLGVTILGLSIGPALAGGGSGGEGYGPVLIGQLGRLWEKLVALFS